jgi:hypothetical protein
MSHFKLERSVWRTFLDDASRTLLGKRAEIEVSSRDLGSQVVARRLPLLGIVYDEHNDFVEVVLDGLDHLVYKPLELYVDGPPFAWSNLTVIDGTGALQIVTLHDQLMLTSGR